MANKKLLFLGMLLMVGLLRGSYCISDEDEKWFEEHVEMRVTKSFNPQLNLNLHRTVYLHNKVTGGAVVALELFDVESRKRKLYIYPSPLSKKFNEIGVVQLQKLLYQYEA